MRFLRKSVIRKLFLYLVLFGLMVAALGFLFMRRGESVVPLQVLLISLGAFLVFFLLVYWYDMIRPLRKILGPIQALMAGKDYKRIYTTRIDEIGILAHFFNQVTESLGEASSTLKDRERMLDELAIASQLQRDILPVAIPTIKGLQVVAKTRPASELGGDCFNVFSMGNKTYIYIGDVTGHGVASGLIMTMFSSLFSVFADMYDSPYEVMVHVNKYIKKHVKKSMFMTMVLLTWDSKLEKLSYVGAGHEHILVYRAATGECDAILSGGVALGMVPDNSKIIKELEIELSDGDFIVLYSDGITEARNVEGELYGLERLKAAIKEYCPQYSAEGVHYHIAKNVSEYMEGTQQADDMTLIVMKRDSSFTGVEEAKDKTTTF